MAKGERGKEGRFLLINILIDYQYLLLNQIKSNLKRSLLKKIEFESYSLGPGTA